MSHDTQDPLDPMVQLREELGRVSVSQSFADRVRERLADDLEPLRAELSDLAVSPEFAVRVRQSVEAQEARRGAWGFNWRWLVPATGLAAAAIAAVVLWPRQQETAPISPVIETARTQPDTSATPVAPPAATSSSQPSAPPANLARAGRAARTAARTVESVASESMKRDPMLEVMTNQPALIRQWMEQLAAAPASVLPESISEIAIAPIEVDPIVVKWFIEPVLPGALPIILRLIADQADRSAK